MYSKFLEISKTTPPHHVPEILQRQHFINIFTNADGGHVSNFIRQSPELSQYGKLTSPIEQSLQESSSEMDKLPCMSNTIHSPDKNYRDWDKRCCWRILNDGKFQLTETWSAKILEEVVEEAQKCNTFFP